MRRRSPSLGRWIVTAIAVSGCGPLGPLLTGTLAVEMRPELDFGDTELGLALAAAFGLGGLLGLPGGRAADRLGWRRAGLLAAAITTGTLLGIATLARTPLHLIAFLLTSGVAISLAIPSAALLISSEIPAERRGLSFGVNQSSVPVATLLAGLSVPLLALTVGWRWSFVVATIWPLTAAVLLATGPPPHAVPRGPSILTGRDLAGDRALVLLTVGAALGMLGVGALNAFFAISSVDAGLPSGETGVLIGIASIGGVALRVGIGAAADRRQVADFRHVAGLMVAGGIGFACVGLRVTPAIVLGALLCFSAGWGYTGLFMFLVVGEWSAAPGAAVGFANQGMSVAAAVGPFAFGAGVGRIGFGPSWFTVAVLDVVGAGLLVAGWRVLARARGPRRAPVELAGPVTTV